MQNSVLTTKLLLTGRSSTARQCQTPFWVVLYSFSYGGWRGECGKFVEVDWSCFIGQKYNCGRLRMMAWVFVDVKRELGTLVLHLSLIAPPRHCWPSVRRVSYLAPLSSVTAVGTFVSSMKHSRTMLSIALSVCSTWMLTQIWSRPLRSTSWFTSGLTEKKLNLW
jgi:hypothetical protein